jgi:ribosome-associated protein
VASKKNSKLLARRLAQEIDRRKGIEITILDLRKTSSITDYFVIANGLSDVHLKNLAEHLMDVEQPHHIEGLTSAHWVLLDYVDVVVHLFLADTRQFYGLERLWGDAPVVRVHDD